MTCAISWRSERCGMPPSVSVTQRRNLMCDVAEPGAGLLSFSRGSLRCSPFTYDEVELRIYGCTAPGGLSALTRFEDDMVMAQRCVSVNVRRDSEVDGGREKTSSEIAIILSISEKPLTSIRKTCEEGCAPNKTQIACYAAAAGLI